jgi:hypothetical protein
MTAFQLLNALCASTYGHFTVLCRTVKKTLHMVGLLNVHGRYGCWARRVPLPAHEFPHLTQIGLVLVTHAVTAIASR